MKQIIKYIGNYFKEQDKNVLLLTTVFTAVFIYFNYHYGIDKSISNVSPLLERWGLRFGVYLVAFSIPYLLYTLLSRKKYITNRQLVFLLFTGAALFGLKASLGFDIKISDDAGLNNYWQHVFYWPLLLLITITVLLIIWKTYDNDQPFYGLKTKNVTWTPYLLMLLIMLPLIAAASTQADFLAMYPKLNSVVKHTGLSGWQKVLFELSYGSDFFTIEVFFRGFLVLAFIKWAGKDAILPMACFYCSIHFGKPLGECISSYFGGLLLGIVVYNTRSIFGGLIVHLGIAWLMEIGGYIGNSLSH